MYKTKKQHFMMRVFAICTVVILISASLTSLAKPAYNLTVETERPQYYPGEEVNISGRLTEDGSGVMGGICINVTDPDGTLLLGVCIQTDPGGYYGISIILELNATLGTYNVTAEEHEHGVQASTTFEVISSVACGDVTDDGIINIGDVVFLINYLYRGGIAPDPVCIGDVNCDGTVNLGDVVKLINYLYRGDPAPSPDCCE